MIRLPLLASGRAPTACVLTIVAIGLGACGSSSSTTSTDSAAASSGASSGSSSTFYRARVNLAKCYRSQGINMPDPSPSGGHTAGGGAAERVLSQYPQAKVQAARQACRQYIAKANPQLNASPAGQAQFGQEFLKFAKCMRANGVSNFPDRMQDVEADMQSGALSMNSPAFQSALQACQSLAAPIQQGIMGK